MKFIRNTATSWVYEYICAHPGCTRKEILTIFPPGTSPRTPGTLLANLQKHKVIENKGGNTVNARWYPIEFEADENYLRIATELMNELEVLHPVVREAYLARRLQEIFA